MNAVFGFTAVSQAEVIWDTTTTSTTVIKKIKNKVLEVSISAHYKFIQGLYDQSIFFEQSYFSQIVRYRII